VCVWDRSAETGDPSETGSARRPPAWRSAPVVAFVSRSGRRLGTWYSESNLKKTGPTLAILAILGLAFGLRLYRLGAQGIWWDEGHAIWAARQSLAQVTDITAHDVHPPLYLWMLHAWLRIAGDSELAVRYLSLAGGLLTVALTYVLARRLLGRNIALLATFLIATARFHIWWSQEARMYVWAAWFALLATYFLLRLYADGASSWWLYILSGTAALYTLYLAVLALLVHNLFVLITFWRKPHKLRFLANWGLAQLSVLGLYTPWLYVALTQTRTDTAKTPFPFYLIWQLYGIVLATGNSTDLDRYVWVLVAFGLLAVAGIALLVWDRTQPQRYGLAGWEIGLLFSLPLVLPPTVIYALSIPRGIYYSPKPEARYLLILAPMFYMLLAAAIAHLWQRGRWGKAMAAVAFVVVLATFVSALSVHYEGRYLRDDYQSAMWALAAYAQPGDAVLLVSGDRYPVFLYHYQRRFAAGSGPQVYLLPMHSTTFTPENVDAELAPLSEQHDRLWLASFERTLQDPENLVESWLEAHRSAVLNVPEDYNYLRLYESAAPDGEVLPPAVDLAVVQPQHAVELEMQGGGLVGHDLPTWEFRPGDAIRPGLYLWAERELALDLAWIDPAGQVVARQVMDVPITGRADRGTRIAPAFAVYGYTAPGQYSLQVCDPAPEGGCVRIPAGQVTHSQALPRPGPYVQHEVELGDGAIQFLGYRVAPSEVRAGGSLDVELVWKGQTWLDEDYTVFVHMLGPYNPETGGPVWAHDDSYPLQGGHPTSRWLPGQVVADRHVLHVPRDTPEGVFQMEVGLYDARTGQRLSVQGGADRILLGDVTVTRP
jgi:4-amino-4-deoxy-L-arabinose transferase-like glycosyltransferase